MEPKRIPIGEFRELGFLQEVNRQFFHPRGLALEVILGADGEERLGGIWDYREDPEGILFSDLSGEECAAKRDRVQREYERHEQARLLLLKGTTIQQIGSVMTGLEVERQIVGTG